MSWPDFFLIGAPKCGTTSVADFLGAHPNVYVPPHKEPTFFALDLPGYRMMTDPGEYQALFAGAGPGTRVTGEGSVWHLFSEVAVAEILAVRPDAKFIIVLRDPVEMVHSLHAQFCQNYNEDELDFAKAWALQVERARGRFIPPTVKVPQVLQYGEVGKFGAQVARVLERVDRNSVFLVRFEQLMEDGGESLARLQRFLGVPVIEGGRLPHSNSARTNRSRLVGRLLYRPPAVVRVPVDAAKRVLGIRGTGIGALVHRVNRRPLRRRFEDGPLKSELREWFADDLRLLEQLTGWDLTAWRTG